MPTHPVNRRRIKWGRVATVVALLVAPTPPVWAAEGKQVRKRRRGIGVIKPAEIYQPHDLAVRKSSTNPGLMRAVLNSSQLIVDRDGLFGRSFGGLSFPAKEVDQTTRILLNSFAAAMERRGLSFDKLDLERVVTPAERRSINELYIDTAREVLGRVQRARPRDFAAEVLRRAKRERDKRTRTVLEYAVARIDRLARDVGEMEGFSRADQRALSRATSRKLLAARELNRQLGPALRQAGAIDVRLLPTGMPSLSRGRGAALLAELADESQLEPLFAHLRTLRAGRAQFAYLARQAGNLRGSELVGQRKLGERLGQALARYIEEVWGAGARSWLRSTLARRSDPKMHQWTLPGQYHLRRGQHLTFDRDDLVEQFFGDEEPDTSARQAFDELLAGFRAVGQLLHPERRAQLTDIVAVSEGPHGSASFYDWGFELIEIGYRGTRHGHSTPAITFGGRMGPDSVPFLLGFRLQSRGGMQLNLMLNDLLARRSFGRELEGLGEITGQRNHASKLGVRAAFVDPVAGRIREPEEQTLFGGGDTIGPNYVLQATLKHLTEPDRAFAFFKRDPEAALLLLQHLQAPVDPEKAKR